MKRFGWILALLLLIIPTFFSLLRPGMHNIQDSMQYFRIYELNQCFKDSQIPCHWVPDMGYGFGYPLFLYYSPGPYYLGELINLIGFGYINAVKILFILGFIVSALGMAALLWAIFKSKLTSIAGTVLYIYAPVRAVQVYVRGSLGEFLSMAIFPWIFLFSYRFIKGRGRFNGVLLGISIAALLLTHNLMSLAFLPLLCVWVFILVLLEKKEKTGKLLQLFIYGLLGIGMAAFYVMPLIFERNLVHLESMIGGYFSYGQHFVDLYQLFISNHWGYGSSQLGPGDDLSLSLGQVQWVLALVAVILACKNYKKHQKISMAVFALTITCLGYIFLMHQRSNFVWNNLSFMALFQFPWRFLVITAFVLALLASYAINYFNGMVRTILVVSVVLVTIGVFGGYFRPQKWLNITDKEMLSGEEFTKQQTASIFDYLPKSAVLPPNCEAPKSAEVIRGKAIVNSYVKGSDFQTANIVAETDGVVIRVPLFDFAGMMVNDNGVIINHNHNECSGQEYCFGQISFSINKGEHMIKVYLTDTLPRKIGNIISLLTTLLLGLFFLRKRTWLS